MEVAKKGVEKDVDSEKDLSRITEPLKHVRKRVAVLRVHNVVRS